MSSSDGFDGPLFRDVSPRIPKSFHDVPGTWTQTTISCRNSHPRRTPPVDGDGDLASVRTARTWSVPMRPKGRTGFKISICSFPAWPPRSSQIVVQAPGGFEWATEPDPSGAALAEYFPSTTVGAGRPVYQPAGQERHGVSRYDAPAGRLDGKLIQLANGMTLTVTIDYQGQTAPDMATVDVSNLVSATDPDARGRHSRQRGRHISGHGRRTGRDRSDLRTRFRPSGRDRSERRGL